MLQHFSEERVIDRGMDVLWPARSPDLTSFIPNNLEQLKQKVIQKFATVSVEEIQLSVQNIIHRS